MWNWQRKHHGQRQHCIQHWEKVTMGPRQGSLNRSPTNPCLAWSLGCSVLLHPPGYLPFTCPVQGNSCTKPDLKPPTASFFRSFLFFALLGFLAAIPDSAHLCLVSQPLSPAFHHSAASCLCSTTLQLADCTILTTACTAAAYCITNGFNILLLQVSQRSILSHSIDLRFARPAPCLQFPPLRGFIPSFIHETWAFTILFLHVRFWPPSKRELVAPRHLLATTSF
ncbi:hypothetical protein V2G26_006591 [Clonostachys chloroleuca]